MIVMTTIIMMAGRISLNIALSLFPFFVFPAKAGTQGNSSMSLLDSRLRGNDGVVVHFVIASEAKQSSVSADWIASSRDALRNDVLR
jgi:hypothetical protein